jgi:WD40 repeat protein
VILSRLKIKLTAALLLVACVASGCRQVEESAGLKVAPKSLRDVPAARLAFRFEPDVSGEKLPERLRKDEPEEPLATIKTDFETRRGNTEALIRTVVDPSGQRALALYGTSATETDFRIDLYSVEGQFIRNVLPPDLTGVFPAEVAWSPDGQSILFSGIRNPALSASPTPAQASPPDITQPSAPNEQPAPEPSVAPAIPSVQTFRTEQIYTGDRDGFNLRPLTSREGLIYFQLAWSPDGSQIAALACKEDEWESRRNQGLLPVGRPRLITLDGRERLLDDRATPVAPAWSPDGSKVATAFDYDVAIYDAEGAQPGGAGLSLQDQLRAASADYDARVFKKNETQGSSPANSQRGGPQGSGASQNTSQASSPQSAGASVLISMNPVVRLEWVEPETIFAETAFVRFYRSEPLPTFKYTRWHALHLSPQAAVLGSNLRAPRRVI